jgi:hypothetical protein
MDDAALAALKQKIDQLQTLYFVLFSASLVILALQWFVIGRGTLSSLLWILSLGGAVGVRVYRTSLVNRYNAHINGQLQ